MSKDNELTDFLKRQAKIEHEIVKSLDKALPDINNPAVRGVLKGISMDSVKHGYMYDSAVNLLTEVPPALTQENLERQRALVKKHIKMEAELIEEINKRLPQVENEKVKLLLEGILDDEKRHHELLKEILEILVRGETITEEDWWDFLWKNVPFHGAPGG